MMLQEMFGDDFEELLDVLGFDCVHDALVKMVIDRGLWKEEWGEPPEITVYVGDE